MSLSLHRRTKSGVAGTGAGREKSYRPLGREGPPSPTLSTTSTSSAFPSLTFMQDERARMMRKRYKDISKQIIWREKPLTQAHIQALGHIQTGGRGQRRPPSHPPPARPQQEEKALEELPTSVLKEQTLLDQSPTDQPVVTHL